MAKYKHVNREQGVMLCISFENQIMSGTFEHTIDYLVENRIDTNKIDLRYKNDDTGAPAYSPKVLLKIVLLAYSRGIISSRKIARACEENIIFMALTGGLAPDYSTIANFISSLGKDIKDIFIDVLMVCEELDLLGATEFALDGCKITSSASKEWSGTFSDLKKKKDKLEKTVKFLVEKHKSNDKLHDNVSEKEKYERQIEKIKTKALKIEKFLKSNEPKLKSRKGERQSNITDNESAKMKTSHGVIQGYNGMAISDSKHQIIVNAETFGEGQEYDLLKPLFEGAKGNCKKIGLGKDYFVNKRIIADTGSFCEDNLKYLSQEKVDAYIPDQQFRKRDPRFADAERFKTENGKPNKRYTKEYFTYNEKENTFTCPAGKTLKYSGSQVFNNTEGRKYISSRSNCGICDLKDSCLKSEKTRYRTLYIIERFFNRNYSDEMKQKIDTVEGRHVYSRRMGIIEPVFGNIRESKGLDRFTLRSKVKTNIQWLCYCIVHNTEKIQKYGNYLKLMEA